MSDKFAMAASFNRVINIKSYYTEKDYFLKNSNMQKGIKQRQEKHADKFTLNYASIKVNKVLADSHKQIPFASSYIAAFFSYMCMD